MEYRNRNGQSELNGGSSCERAVGRGYRRPKFEPGLTRHRRSIDCPRQERTFGGAGGNVHGVRVTAT